MAVAEEQELSEIIRPTGFYKSKAKALLGLAGALVEEHDGVPHIVLGSVLP